jgi:hypothetical protein
MFVSTATALVETQNIGDTRRGAIKTSPRMYRQFVDTLYSNKPDAIVRELMANMDDGHKAAGTTDVPFEVCAPTDLDPYLVFKDFGTGMTREQVLERFLTLGDSDKADSDDFTGGFGLGCKVHLAYIDKGQTIIETRQNGVVHTFASYWGPDGWPSITDMGSAPTDEPNGMTIRIPIRKDDYHVFSEVISRRACRFVPAPISNVKFQVQEIKIDHELFTLYRVGDKPAALMGAIAYRINFEALNLRYGDPRRNLADTNMTLKFKVGELEPALNREGLSYTEKTINALTTRLDQVVAALIEEGQKTLQAQPNLFEASRFFRGDLPPELRRLFSNDVAQYKGVDVSNDLRLHNGQFCRLGYRDLRRVNPPISWRSTAFVHPEKMPPVIHIQGDFTTTSLWRRLTRWGVNRFSDVLLFKGDISALHGFTDVIVCDDQTMPEPPKAPRQSRSG